MIDARRLLREVRCKPKRMGSGKRGARFDGLEEMERRVMLSGHSYKVVADFGPLGLSSLEHYTLQASDGALANAQSDDIEMGSMVATVAAFDGTNGGNLLGNMVRDEDGNLYGTAMSGYGTIYEIVKATGMVRTLATGLNGSEPLQGLVRDGRGDLFGTTMQGGENEDGTVFELVRGRGMIKTLVTFNGRNGSEPVGGLVMDSDGNLFGTTSKGGAENEGEVFEIYRKTRLLKVLVSFDGVWGGNPQGDLLLDRAGNLYGTTYGASHQMDGSVFKIAKGTDKMTVLATVDSTRSGPLGGLVMDHSGNLYGTTGGMWRGDNGTIFEVTKGGTFQTLAAFNGVNGSSPETGMVMDAAGNLFGTVPDGAELEMEEFSN